MLKTNHIIKRNLNYSFNLLVSILIIFFSKVQIVSASNINWIEVSKTNAGVQYLDLDSLEKKGKETIEITTKYLKIDPITSKKIEENIYRMKINCLTNKFQDISVNGKIKLNKKWEDPRGDKLLNDVISDCCENV